jgi:PhzF family phenazine biosynthesis protein
MAGLRDDVAPTVLMTSVFADGPDGGNPCPVVLGARDWTTEHMRATAAEFGHETAFVLPATDGGDVRLRYFVPRHEMEMCVHATVAATLLLAGTGRLTGSPARIETPLGIREVTWDVGESRAIVAQSPPTFGPALTARQRDRLLSALGLPESALDLGLGPIRSVSTARPKLMIPLRDEHVLDGLTPDFARLWDICDELDVTGCYPFTRGAADVDAAARQFPRRAGYPEDPATGVAACALGAYLAGTEPGTHRFVVAQGRAMGRPSRIEVEVDVTADGTITATRVGGHMRALPEGATTIRPLTG